MLCNVPNLPSVLTKFHDLLTLFLQFVCFQITRVIFPWWNGASCYNAFATISFLSSGSLVSYINNKPVLQGAMKKNMVHFPTSGERCTVICMYCSQRRFMWFKKTLRGFGGCSASHAFLFAAACWGHRPICPGLVLNNYQCKTLSGHTTSIIRKRINSTF